MKSQTRIRVKSGNSVRGCDLYGFNEKNILDYFIHMGILIPINILGIFIWNFF